MTIDDRTTATLKPDVTETTVVDDTSLDVVAPDGSQRGHRLRQAMRTLGFPVVATLGFLLLVGLGWNGSSSAAIRLPIEGSQTDPQQVFGSPNPLRSDEWLVGTPVIVSQDSDNYPRVNRELLGGTDVSITSQIAYRDWSVLFRPQYWGFLVLPFQQAFAFSWWFPAWLLAVSCYALLRAICPQRPLMAAAAGVAICFAPFVQWWYLTMTLGSLGWAAAISASYVALCDAQTGRRRAGLIGLMAFSTAAFLLLMYPAFQVACSWVVVAFVLGWTFRSGTPSSLKRRLRQLGMAGASGALGVAVFGLFLATRWDVIQRQADTEYPGHRVIGSGGGRVSWLLSGFLDRNLASGLSLPPILGTNSSEASGFVYIGLFLVVPAAWLLRRAWQREHRIDGLLAALLALLAFYLAFLFVPGLDILAKLTLLSIVSPNRLYIGIGLLSLMLTGAVIREMDRQHIRAPWWLVLATAVGTLAVLWRTGVAVERIAPDLAGSVWSWLPLACAVAGIVALATRGHGTVALCGLAVFSIGATYRVNPVYDGVYDTRGTAIGQAIADVDGAEPGGWIASGSPSTIGVLTQQPVERHSGVAFHPNFDEWSLLDPDGSRRPIYNRYAMVSFSEDPTAPDLGNPGPDQVLVKLDACGRFAQDKLAHVLADHRISDSCLQLNRAVRMPDLTFYIYDVVAP